MACSQTTYREAPNKSRTRPKTVENLRLDVAFNNAGSKVSGPIAEQSKKTGCTIDIISRRLALLKYEISRCSSEVVAGLSPTWLRRSWIGSGAATYSLARWRMGLTKSAASENARTHRVNIVCLRESKAHGERLGRAGGEKVARPPSPSARLERQEKSPKPLCGCVRTRHLHDRPSLVLVGTLAGPNLPTNARCDVWPINSHNRRLPTIKTWIILVADLFPNMMR